MISIEKADVRRFKVNMKVFGIGGGGCNAINNMIMSDFLNGIDFYAVNTDMQVLEKTKTPNRLTIGSQLTKGLGAAGDPDIGRKAALEDKDRIKESLSDTSLLFLTTGMGGGTGTGATPVIATIAKEMGVLTVAVVSKPFEHEGKARTEHADRGIEELKQIADAVIVIPNQRLYQIQEAPIAFWQAFKMVDNVLLDSVRGIAELLDTTGVINVDFSDLSRIMRTSGETFIGFGSGNGENKAVEAAQKAVDCPLMEDLTMEGADQVLMNVIGGHDFDLNEMDRVVKVLEKKTGGYKDMKYGVVIDESMNEKMKVTIIAKSSPKAAKRGTEMLRNPKLGKDEGNPNVLTLTPPNRDDFETPAVLRRKVD